MHLGARADAAGLDLGVVAERRLVFDHRAGPQVAERTDRDALADRGAFEDRKPHAAARADLRVAQRRCSVRSHSRARCASDRAGGSRAESTASGSISTSGSMYVVAGSTMVTPERMQGVERALAQDRLGFGQLQSIVHAVAPPPRLRCSTARTLKSLRARQVDQFGQVVLAFGADAAAAPGWARATAPRTASRRSRSRDRRALRRSRRLPRPCARRCRRRCAHDAAVAVWVAHFGAEQGDRCVGSNTCFDQPLQTSGPHQRHVAEVDQHALGASGFDALGRHLDGVPGAELRLLDDRVDRFGQRAAHLVGLVAEDDDRRLRRRPARPGRATRSINGSPAEAGAASCAAPNASAFPVRRPG